MVVFVMGNFDKIISLSYNVELCIYNKLWSKYHETRTVVEMNFSTYYNFEFCVP